VNVFVLVRGSSSLKFPLVGTDLERVTEGMDPGRPPS
jgi:hypothetical protein